MSFFEIIPISAKTGLNINIIKSIVQKNLPNKPHKFKKDKVTNCSRYFIFSEIIREKLFRFLFDELPYFTTVRIENFKINNQGGYSINALIFVAREKQKKIIIGSKGNKIKLIGINARKDMQKMLEAPVFLSLRVKVMYSSSN